MWSFRFANRHQERQQRDRGPKPLGGKVDVVCRHDSDGGEVNTRASFQTASKVAVPELPLVVESGSCVLVAPPCYTHRFCETIPNIVNCNGNEDNGTKADYG